MHRGSQCGVSTNPSLPCNGPALRARTCYQQVRAMRLAGVWGRRVRLIKTSVHLNRRSAPVIRPSASTGTQMHTLLVPGWVLPPQIRNCHRWVVVGVVHPCPHRSVAGRESLSGQGEDPPAAAGRRSPRPPYLLHGPRVEPSAPWRPCSLDPIDDDQLGRVGHGGYLNVLGKS